MKKILMVILLILFSVSLISCNVESNIKTESNEQTNNIETATNPTEDGETQTNGTTDSNDPVTEINPGEEDGKTEVVVEESPSILYLKSLFGSDIDIYTNEERNPYGVDLNKYGSNVSVYFYEPNITTISDPYTNVNKTEFYANYERATTYEDAYYRTKHNLMSGDITDQTHLHDEGKLVEEDKAIKFTDATYVLDADGKYLAFIPNVIEGENYIIFYGAAYTSLNDVSAYLLAFGSVPANQIANKKNTSQAISLWGKYGRVNDSEFYGGDSYKYEPDLPTNDIYLFHEIDFGTIGNYYTGTRKQSLYNNGSSITRGAARLVYTADSKVTRIDDRKVFYTYNHYNDFQEYLNYHNGWGVRFGNESAGNPYCSGKSDYNSSFLPPTPCPETLLKKYSDMQ